MNQTPTAPMAPSEGTPSSQAPAAVNAAAGPVLRTVVLHYHLFKNAGTTVDSILGRSFPGRCVAREFEGPPAKIPLAVEAWIQEFPEAICFSSHTARFPLPVLPGIRALPILFLRHPIARIRSAYAFERRQQAGTFGSVLARHTTFQGYVEIRLALKNDRAFRNFQALRLSEMFPPATGTELERALSAVAQLPFVGLVERFDGAIRFLSTKMQEYGLSALVPADGIAENTSEGSPKPLEDTLESIRSELGGDLYALLEEANADDLELYGQSLRLYLAG